MATNNNPKPDLQQFILRATETSLKFQKKIVALHNVFSYITKCIGSNNPVFTDIDELAYSYNLHVQEILDYLALFEFQYNKNTKIWSYNPRRTNYVIELKLTRIVGIYDDEENE